MWMFFYSTAVEISENSITNLNKTHFIKSTNDYIFLRLVSTALVVDFDNILGQWWLKFSQIFRVVFLIFIKNGIFKLMYHKNEWGYPRIFLNFWICNKTIYK